MEILDELFNAFEKRYQPAANVVESDDQLSSNEILNLFNSAAEITKDELYKGLRSRNFVTEMVGNQFLWLVKEQKSPY